MLNNFIVHDLPGKEVKQMLCTCGYEKFFKDIKMMDTCPNCGAKRFDNFSSLSFGEQTYERTFSVVEEDMNTIYKFDLNIGYFKGVIKADFEKERVDFVKSKCQSEHWKICFDAHKRNKEDIITIINVNTGAIIEDLTPVFNFLEKTYATSYGLTNLNRSLKKSKFMDGIYSGGYNIISTMKKYVDMIYKCKDFCVKNELIIKSGIEPVGLNGVLDFDKTTPAEQLKLSPYMFKFLRENKPSIHKGLQMIEELFKEQAVNYINTFGKLNHGLDSYEIRRMAALVNEANLSIKKLYKFLYKEAPYQQGLYNPHQTLTLLYDTFDLTKKLGLPFDKNPKALQRYHDVLSREYAIVKDQKRHELFKESIADYKHLELIQELKFDEENKPLPSNKKKYAMVLPKDAQDLVKEGKVMHHCVGGYIDRVIDKNSIIMFLRKAEDIESSFATIEIDPDNMKIYQVKAKNNNRVKDNDAIKFLENWCKKKNIVWNGSW